jgi:hypothetical protein
VDVSADTIGGDDPRGTLTFSEAMTSYDGIGFNGGGNPSQALAVQPVGYASFLLGAMTSSARAHFVAGAPYQCAVILELSLEEGLELSGRTAHRQKGASH